MCSSVRCVSAWFIQLQFWLISSDVVKFYVVFFYFFFYFVMYMHSLTPRKRILPHSGHNVMILFGCS